jgi:hypothetical protein
MTEVPTRPGATYPGGVDYATDEHPTGISWVDGKPIFRRVILLAGGNASSAATIADIYAAIEQIVNFTWSSRFSITNIVANFGATDNGLNITSADLLTIGHNGINLTGETLQIVLEYTKP